MNSDVPPHWNRAATAAEVHTLFQQTKTILERLERVMLERLADLESAQHSDAIENRDRLYDLANLHESHGARHDLLEASTRKQSVRISELSADTEQANQKTDARTTQHDVAIEALNARIRELVELTESLSSVVQSGQERDRNHENLVVREARSMRWVVALLVPAMTALFAAVAEALKLASR